MIVRPLDFLRVEDVKILTRGARSLGSGVSPTVSRVIVPPPII